MKIPRILISSVSGKSGKTTVTIALIKKLREHGLRVQPFKVGPDFIDPSYHTYFSGTYSRNLDSVMFSEETILASFIKNSSNSDVAVIEGVFGLYDSVDGVTEKGSTAEISKILRTPVILVMNAERINRGLIPILRGFREFDRKVRIRGVIINNIANERQKEKIVKAFREEFKDVEVVGTVPRSRIVEEKMRYRHLGLTPVSERSREMVEVEEAIKFVGEHIEIDKIIEISREAEDLPEIELDFPRVKVNVRVGVMIDDVFSFYYPENVEYIQNTAQRIVTINSLKDSKLPEIDMLYIGGGFPEVYAEALEKNKTMKKEIVRNVEKGMKIYAECGGLMYLSEKVKAFDNKEYEMVGLIDGFVEMFEKPVGHGYTYLEALRGNPLADPGSEVVGHEFHYSKINLREEVDYAFKVKKGYGVNGVHDGIIKENILAMYTHLHVLHNYRIFLRMLKWVEES